MRPRRTSAFPLVTVLVLVVVAVLTTVMVVMFMRKAPKCPEPEPAPAHKCPPYASSFAWAYQDPKTCVDTWRIGVYFNVSEANQHLVNISALRDFYDALEPWMLHNVVPHYQRTVKATIFDGDNLPPNNDWSPYIIQYVNDVNQVQVGGCAWHWTHSPGISSWFQLGSMSDIIGPWAPLPPDGWPVISTPIGVHGSFDYDGAWDCYNGGVRWGWGTSFFDIFTIGIFHEIMEKLYDWNSAQFVATHTTATQHVGGLQWFIMETGDPVEFGVPMTIPGKHRHQTYRIPNFVLPAYFGGCLSPYCGPPTGPLDFLGTVTESFVPANGAQLLVITNGTYEEACTLIVSEHFNGGSPLLLCSSLAGTTTAGESFHESALEERTRGPSVYSLNLLE